MKRLPAVALVAALLVCAGSASAASSSGAPLLAIVDHSPYGRAGTLVRLDPRTLRRLPGPAVALGAFEDGWSFSPDRHELVAGFANPSCVGGESALRVIDTERMRTLADVSLLPNGTVEATTWIDATHVLAVVQASDCLKDTGTIVFTVDAAAHRVMRRTRIPGEVVGVAPAAHRLVLLLAPRNAIGTASLAVLDSRRGLRRVALRGIRAGVVSPAVVSGSSTPPRSVVPALAADGSSRAFVVTATGVAAEVDLATLRIKWRVLRQVRSLAKGPTGPLRTAVWLPNGRLALTGWNFSTTAQATPIGLELVDTRTWRFARIASGISTISASSGVLFAAPSSAGGLTAYSPAGRRLYRLFPRRGVWFWGTAGGAGYLEVDLRRPSMTAVFDVATGRVMRTLAAPGQLLLGNAASFAVAPF